MLKLLQQCTVSTEKVGVGKSVQVWSLSCHLSFSHWANHLYNNKLPSIQWCNCNKELPQQNITKTFFLEATKGKKATNVLRTKKGILYEKESLAHLWEFTTDMISPVLGPFHIKQHFHPEKKKCFWSAIGNGKSPMTERLKRTLEHVQNNSLMPPFWNCAWRLAHKNCIIIEIHYFQKAVFKIFSIHITMKGWCF